MIAGGVGGDIVGGRWRAAAAAAAAAAKASSGRGKAPKDTDDGAAELRSK